MKHTLALVLMVFGLVGCSEVSSSKKVSDLKDELIGLSCSVGKTIYLNGNTGKVFRETNPSDSSSFRFAMEINKSEGTIKTTWMLDFKNLHETELEYSALAYGIVDSDEATARLTIDRMSLKWKLHTFDSNMFNFAPANGEPKKQSSFANGQCYKANKI